ncbi:8-amino-7-oxononanoate synthase [Sulfuritalea sp.]|jgi:8-amino-7-oxononanoate synthase|uniref:aminotransferase class I/II-fold pyridoxal phosphate-dependent enzyme n=1 Tax=Sulfuritalea sp. TaxID=2480090 RepID=UPI001AC251AD|nr:8-amino-7-oxononanoate synthase [Sulfuritalea sp.]MBN8473309.1 8-amino-7-oxononanoate synthase [Sulfuritalea sp.]
MDNTLDTLLQVRLDSFDAVHRRRRLRPVHWQHGHLRDSKGRVLIDASSNDYLGLSQHPLVKARAAEWAERHGAGAPASRLITGTRDITLAVEEKLAAFKGCEAALLFSCGFQANATVIPALAKVSASETALFSDELNHASIIHGATMAKAANSPLSVFRHNDLNHLEELLEKHSGRKLILTESVFSMDGDRADLPALVQLAERHGAALYVDEAHASGVLGPGGRGLAADQGVDLVMGTLGKAFGAFGAYIAGSRALIDYLTNRCSGFVYTTALPPPVLGAVDASLELIPGMDADRHRLTDNAKRLRQALAAAGLATLGSTTQIVPAVIGSETAALAAAERLEEAGILAVAIRPPTVAEGTSRLRFALGSHLSEKDMTRLLDAIKNL